ncbi:hypothetical protein Tco_1259802 [Tanacetum coccineum]
MEQEDNNNKNEIEEEEEDSEEQSSSGSPTAAGFVHLGDNGYVGGVVVLRVGGFEVVMVGGGKGWCYSGGVGCGARKVTDTVSVKVYVIGDIRIIFESLVV